MLVPHQYAMKNVGKIGGIENLSGLILPLLIFRGNTWKTENDARDHEVEVALIELLLNCTSDIVIWSGSQTVTTFQFCFRYFH